MLVGVAFVQPQDIVVAIVCADVAVSVARVQIHLTVAVDIACGKAVHRVAVGEHVGHLGEGLVSIVVEIGMNPSAVDEVHVAVVVKVLHFGLEKEACDFQAAALGDVRELACAVVLKQEQGRAVVGDQTIKVSIVVHVCKVCRPALLKKDQSPRRSFLRVIALAVVDPQLIDPARVLWIVDELAALGDVEVQITVPVEVRPNGAIVAAVVRVGIASRVVAGQRHQA